MNHDDRQRALAAQTLCARLQTAGYRALFAGGCVRDYLLGVRPEDIDIATNARPEQIMALFEKCLAVGAKFGVVMVVLPEGIFEVATFRSDGAYSDGRHPDSVSFTDEVADASRRDFTINALFLDPDTHEVLDYVGGVADLRAGIIRAVGAPALRFQEDRLRMLRAVRFSSRLGYGIEPATMDALRAQAPAIIETSAERIRDEIIKMLTEGRARTALELLDLSGLLAMVLPEVAAMKGVEQPEGFHPEGDVFTHTCLALDELTQDVSATLAFATLLHDVGKPPTQTFEDRIRFNRHEKVGARISETICRRLRISNRETERVVWLVENHMRLMDFFKMREHRRRRLAREAGFEELLALGRIDARASHGDTSLCDAAEQWRDGLAHEQLKPPPLLSGRDLIAMGYAPGPLFRRILEDVETQQLEGMLTDATQARDYVRMWFSEKT